MRFWLATYRTCQGSDKPAHLRSFIRSFSTHIQSMDVDEDLDQISDLSASLDIHCISCAFKQ